MDIQVGRNETHTNAHEKKKNAKEYKIMIGKCGHNLSFFVFVSSEKRQCKLQKSAASGTNTRQQQQTKKWSDQASTEEDETCKCSTWIPWT